MGTPMVSRRWGNVIMSEERTQTLWRWLTVTRNMDPQWYMRQECEWESHSQSHSLLLAVP